MRENRIRKNWAADKAVICGWLAIPSAFSAEVMANEDFDAVLVDTQHGMIEVQTAISMLQAISTKSPAPMVRVNWNDPAPIMKLLDAGAYGVICPQIETAEDCARFVAACRYAPRGTRSWGPVRGLLYGGADYFQQYEKQIVKIALIETIKGIENMRAIAATPGIDMLYVGPNDLSIDYGGAPTYVASDPRVIKAMDDSIGIAKEHSIFSGTYAGSVDVARAAVKKGFNLVSVGYAAKLMIKAAAEVHDNVFPGRSAAQQ